MVHYIRFLRTPQVQASKRLREVNAVIAVTTDLGDALLAENLELTIELSDAHNSNEILQVSKAQWLSSSRALKFSIAYQSKHVARTARLHVTSEATVSSLRATRVPELLDVWSDCFTLSSNLQSEPVVERQLVLPNNSRAKIWEETGDSIARHIWHGDHLPSPAMID